VTENTKIVQVTPLRRHSTVFFHNPNAVDTWAVKCHSSKILQFLTADAS